eukprot:TRINITY_DN16536_c0_g1_i1.p1 TRINITY_DN16536_c0_g1~~TRINITY_DN16536_c0_g1_i1.p1  ORF type:complete len:145 (+),score=21.35 TRINITY_DN16536_c0_g1_i1:37-471(+)
MLSHTIALSSSLADLHCQCKGYKMEVLQQLSRRQLGLASTCRALLPHSKRRCHKWASVDINKVVAMPDECSKESAENDAKGAPETWWMPHPVSGVYYPQGHAHLLDFDGDEHRQPLFWLRSTEDVQRPPPLPFASSFVSPFLEP